MEKPRQRLTYWFASVCCVGIVMTAVYLVDIQLNTPDTVIKTKQVFTITGSVSQGRMPACGYSKGKTSVNQRYNILWYRMPADYKHHPGVLNVDFSQCDYCNCEMHFNKSERMNSDAVIFDGRFVQGSDYFERPVGQIWIFSAHEAPVVYDGPRGPQWREAPWRNSFNWTITYNKNNTDIHLPYGILRKKAVPDKRNYTLIASKKTGGALIVTSHCHTRSKRGEYVKELSKYIPVTVLGACGTPWDCGRRYIHDSCFDLLNTTYKFYLAFENALCTQYYTEKFFGNFNYDIIMITRGGNQKEAKVTFPKGTQISTEDFHSAKDLGLYLKSLSDSSANYAKILETKSEYFSLPFKDVYQEAMCDLCKRMNFQTKYYKTISDIEEWAYMHRPCVQPEL